MKKTAILAILLCFLLLASACASTAKQDNTPTPGTNSPSSVETMVKNEDGEIRGSGSSGDYLTKGDKLTDYADGVEGECAADVAMTMSPSMAEPGGSFDVPIEWPADGQINYTAGTLTGAQLFDNRDFRDFMTTLNGEEENRIVRTWQLTRVFHRVTVNVKNGDVAVRGAKVEMLDASGTTLWQSVTDHDGHAYLFFTETVPSSATIRVSMDGAGSVEKVYDGTDEVNVEFAARSAGLKLDLLFMVDTTGSMSDELEYLKVELKDVVTRVGQESGVASIRTSVNFYRDEGDEYIVRYFAFKDDIDEAVANISAQRAYGGGDYEEAVHTALDNAINDHAWDRDSVKIMFLVLDAPPHEKDEVIASISDSIAKAAELGIRIIPVMSSGSDKTCEILFRSIAALSGGRYVFLTNDSGVGGWHEKPDTTVDYEVEKLNDLMVKIICDYCK